MGYREGPIENYLRRRVKEERGQIRKVKWLCRSGAPDDLIWWSGPRAAFVECKAPGVPINPKDPQAREVDKLLRDGWAVYVVDSFEAVDEVIRQVKGTTI